MTPYPKIAAAVVCIAALLCACKPAEKEMQRTADQLGKLGDSIGVDGTAVQTAVADARQAYRSNVQPLVDGAGNSVDGYVKDIETLREARETANAASEQISRIHTKVSITVEQTMREMPQSERELDQMIDQYSKEFAGWLRANFVSVGPAFSAQSRSQRTQLTPRKRPKSISR